MILSANHVVDNPHVISLVAKGNLRRVHQKEINTQRDHSSW